MTKEELLHAVGHVDEEILANCDDQQPKAPRRKIWKLAAAAALFACVVLGVAFSRIGREATPIPEQTEPEFECSMLDTMNGTSAGFGLAASEVSAIWNEGYFSSEDAPEEMTVIFDGVSYTGSYTWSLCASGCAITKDYYLPNDSNANFLEFSVNRETGELADINFVTKDYFAKNAETEPLEDPRNTLPDMARQWASHFIDPDQYEMRLYRTIPQPDPKMTTYIYEFVQVVNGLDTTDKLQIMISDRGLLGYIATGQLGWVEENEKQLEAFALADPLALIQRDSTLSNVKVKGQRYGITPDGKVVLLVNCSVTVKGSMTAGAIVIIENTAQ